MASFGAAFLLLLSCTVRVQAQQNNIYQLAYGQYYNQYSLPYTIYRFCFYNLYNCQASTYSNFCLTYETTCNYQYTTVGGYYYFRLNRYCPAWCNRCRAAYSSSCSSTTTPAPSIPTKKCAYSGFRGIEPRLFNANSASQCQNPWVVALHADAPSTPGVAVPPICQGVLLDNRTVATTLECRNFLDLLRPGTTFYVKIGEYVWTASEPGEKTISADVSSVDYSTGVVKLILNQPLVSYNRCVSPACLPTSDGTINFDRTKCKVTGRGLASSSTNIPFPDSTLKIGNVVISDDIECTNILSILNSTPGGGVALTLTSDGAIGCTSPTESESSACLGDEGGAITCAERTTGEQILVGLVRAGKCDTLKATFFANVTALRP